MATDANSNSLKWSAQLTVTPPVRTPKLPGDKILLPQSALEQLLAAAPVVEEPSSSRINHTPGFDPFNPYTFAAEARARAAVASTRQPQLPHPLTFRIVNPQNGRVIYAGIREFSARDGEVSLSSFLRQSLGLEDGYFLRVAEGGTGEALDVADTTDVAGSQKDLLPTVTVHAKQLPKGTYVRLRPLEAGYDPEDWKALLERHLRDNFTTLTTGEILTVAGGRHGDFRFLVDKVLPEGDGICIVDTDLEVDIEPLNEEQARETLQRRLEKASRAPGTKEGSSLGGPISLGQEVFGQVRRGEYVDYELREWDREAGLNVELEAADGADIDLLVSPFSSRQRARPRDDEHVFGDLSTRSPKRLKLQPTNIELVDAEALYISVHAFPVTQDSKDGDRDDRKGPLQYNLRVTQTSLADEKENEEAHDPEDVQCKNCHQWVPKRTLFLHENFCFRNNVFCPKCKNVFQKSSAEWQNHWHCPDDDAYGNDASSKMKHDTVSHSSYSCPNCSFVAPNLPGLAHHRTATCPGKLILCQFCHLLVPQQGDSDPDVTDPEVLLSGLTPHELIDGSRTTECHLCNKIIRLRDMKTHLRHHDLERLSRPPPAICKNENCGRTLLGSASKATNDSLGLCGICFGPLYVDIHDPEGKALRRRIERRYLSQMLTGCGKPWCHNRYCKTGQKQTTSPTPLPSGSKEILDIAKPLVDAISVKPGVANAAPFYFCTDETSQQRRILAEMLAAEGVYDIEWCVAAVEAGAGDLDKARDWLKGWAPRKGEIRTT
ncbi:hypothetical protein VTN96DRAFT_6334 [Rasamsonia emersonii]|uniref:Uncharacterized protein n=1 Tax=Rasamsonia emersonii (strain ATCC 16479 / CBS 393.64 / IMI 116815) TaxID=1408163 RepID=A0A0F4YUV0_RASE3|nr:hypothetical protein T310_3952 [Rasamsonia emersonii CBS 393.64]KKA22062.1 hypothetical protein T310_3952 [Rasamsonia emersonii CBS 393.64]